MDSLRFASLSYDLVQSYDNIQPYLYSTLFHKVRAASLLARQEPRRGQAPLCFALPPGPQAMPGVKRGVWGEASGAGGSPHNYTARIDLCDKGPSRALVPHEKSAPLSGGTSSNDGNHIRKQARPAGGEASRPACGQGIRTHRAKGPRGPIRKAGLMPAYNYEDNNFVIIRVRCALRVYLRIGARVCA